MTELDHAARKSFRATYTPLKVSSDSKLRAPRRPIEKRGIIANVLIEDNELENLRKDPHLNGRRKEEVRTALKIIEKIVDDNKRGIISQDSTSSSIGDISFDLLHRICQRIADLREQDLKSFRNTYETVSKDYEKRSIEAIKRSSPLNSQSSASTAPSRLKSLKISTAKEPSSINAPKQGMLANVQDRTNTLSEGQIEIKLPDLKSLIRWSVNEGIQKEHAAKILSHMEKNFTNAISSTDYEVWASARARRASLATVATRQLETIEPVGYLHLERLNFVPAGIERGELVHSVPLTPGEEVNIAHKEWSNTSEEFSKIVTDFMEAYSEEGVTEKAEIAQSSNSQEQHSSGFNTGVTASGGYGPVSISTSLGFNVSDSASKSEQTARKHSMETTRKASARSKKEHKMSFKVSSAAGTEDQQIRKIKNPFADRAARVDYYQLLRKWRVDLYRYGVRLTYDLTIPDPGSDLLSKLSEIENIRAQLEEEYTPPPDLGLEEITKDSYKKYVEKYGVYVDPPPDMEQIITLVDSSIQAVLDDKEVPYPWIVRGEINVPEEFRVLYTSEKFLIPDTPIPGSDAAGVKRVDPPEQNLDDAFVGKVVDSGWWGSKFRDTSYGKSGKYTVAVWHQGLERFAYIWKLFTQYRPEVFEKWRQKAWSAFLEADKARYDESRKNLKDKLARLLEEIGSEDPLSLRKIEREEVMKGVLRWLLGPSFDFAPKWVLALGWLPLYATDGSVNSTAWTNVWAYGEKIIKFLHHAIEWENMLYFLYPYFWSVTSDWKEKMSIDHPDLMHRVFLKSGSARVVLTIRPGFERDFIKFMEGYREDLADSPYFTIAEEMEAYANTNYPGVKAANPVENARPLLLPKQQTAWKDMQDISMLLDAYKRNKGNKYPSTAQGLAALSQFTEGKLNGVDGIPIVAIKDPWDHNYVYVSPGDHGDYDLLSYGADGQKDPQEDSQPPRTDENADITSWAEASLIGTWYEYTPTSALDVAFAEEMPDA